MADPTTFAAVWQARAAHREDMRRDPGYVRENVVTPTREELDDVRAAMGSWAESIVWMIQADERA